MCIPTDILRTYLIAVKPIITMNVIEESPHKENDTLTVECIIPRLYPQIQPSDFTISWGDTSGEAVSLKNNDPDQSYSYRVSLAKTLTKEDNGMTVTCIVNPVRGTPVSEQRTLNVQCEYLDVSVREATPL